MSRHHTPARACRAPWRGLLGGVALGIVSTLFAALGARVRVGEDACEKRSPCRSITFDAPDVGDVEPMPKIMGRSRDWTARATRGPWRASPRLAPESPPKIASPMRKCPMLSSTMSGSEILGGRKVEAVTGVDFEAEASRDPALIRLNSIGHRGMPVDHGLTIPVWIDHRRAGFRRAHLLLVRADEQRDADAGGFQPR